MATYKQRIYTALDELLEHYPNALASDAIWALEAMAESLWTALPPPKKGRQIVERQKRYRVI